MKPLIDTRWIATANGQRLRKDNQKKKAKTLFFLFFFVVDVGEKIINHDTKLLRCVALRYECLWGCWCCVHGERRCTVRRVSSCCVYASALNSAPLLLLLLVPPTPPRVFYSILFCIRGPDILHEWTPSGGTHTHQHKALPQTQKKPPPPPPTQLAAAAQWYHYITGGIY